jgi:uncharacterized protein
MKREELLKIVTDYLDRYTTMTVACCEDNRPWAAAVYYARQDLDLIFFSAPGSLHSTMLAKNPTAAAAIHGNYSEWKEIKGLQIAGSVERITSKAAKAKALASCIGRYPFVREFLADPGYFGASAARKVLGVGLYRLRPTTILYIDNEAGFGTRWKLDVANGRATGEPTLV